jgi:iron complex outermembrane receptor protein
LVDGKGAPLAGVQVTVEGTGLGAVSHDNGQYVIAHVPVGTRTIRARFVGYRPQSVPVTVAADQRAAENFTMVEDPLSLSSVVVTGTATPRVNAEARVAITTLAGSWAWNT